MNRRPGFRRSLLALLLAPAVASAQTLYKLERPDGSIIYSDKPVPGAKIVETIDTPPPPPVSNRASPPAPPARRSESGGSQEEGKRPVKANAGLSALDRAEKELQAAQQALEEARRNREAGQDPQPGERLGTASGGSRLSEAYSERLHKLDDAVSAAEQRLQRAYDARNAAR